MNKTCIFIDVSVTNIAKCGDYVTMYINSITLTAASVLVDITQETIDISRQFYAG